MNDNINEHLTKITDKLDNIYFSDKTYSNDKFSKINIYNGNINYPIHKIWLYTPKLKVLDGVSPKKFSNNNSLPLSLVFFPFMDEIKKFYKFIKKLERKIKKKFPDYEFVSCIKKKENFPTFFNIKLPFSKINDDCYEFNFNIYNYSNKRINIDSIRSTSYTKAFIELSHIWIKDNSKIGINWNVLQLKLYPEFDFSKCLFDDDIDHDEDKKNEQETCFHCMYCPNVHARTLFCSSQNNIPPPPPPPPPMPKNFNKKITTTINTKKSSKNNKKDDNKPLFKAPTLNDLLSVKLRKVKKNDNDNDNKNDNGNKDDNKENINNNKNDNTYNDNDEQDSNSGDNNSEQDNNSGNNDNKLNS